MNSRLHIRLHTTDRETRQLRALQHEFARACNLLAPIARQSGVWSRVGLHHLTYKLIRQQFPTLGSQMACNAIYSVSRACRLVYQHPESPFRSTRQGSQTRPTIVFSNTSPVFFDRHTLSLRKGQASMYTLDGRMRFNMPLAAADEELFRQSKLLEVVLQEDSQGFHLTFALAPADQTEITQDTPQRSAPAAVAVGAISESELEAPRPGLLPEYLVISQYDQEQEIRGNTPSQQVHLAPAGAPSVNHQALSGPTGGAS